MPAFRRRDFNRACLLVGCLALGLGCSATGGPRLRPAEGARVVASVGDQPLPPSMGTPGDQVAVDTPEAEPYRNPKARISGRVVDAQGRPVSGATVRLADGSSKAGRDVRTTTDPSGAFTLGGLRPGSGYYLVAEADFGGDAGTATGRTQADTAQTGVQIRLGDAGDDAIPPPARRGRAKPSKSRPISDRAEEDSRPGADDQGNAEDVAAPVESAAVVVGQPARSTSKRSAAPKKPETSGWHKPGSAPDAADDSAAPPAADGDAEPADADAPASLDGGATTRRSRPAAETDDVNPLPPSLPARKTAAADSPGRTAQARRRSRPQPAVEPEPEPAAEADSPGLIALGREAPPAEPAEPAESPGVEAAAGLQPMPSLASMPDPAESLAPPADVALAAVPGLHEPPATDPPAPSLPAVAAAVPAPTPAASGDFVSGEPRPDPAAAAPAAAPVDPAAPYNPFALVAASPPVPARPAAAAPAARIVAPPASADPAATPASSPAAEPAASPADEVAADPAARPRKWGEVVAAAPLAAGAAAAGALASRAGAAATSTASAPTASRPGPLLARRTRAAAAPRADAEALCQFDKRTDQLVDFQLPDLDGQPVRFRDLDADLILLDFWGTWCGQCMVAIPHLVDLQKEYGPTRLRVVGIACERTPPDKRKAMVAATAARLGINYPVLVAKDGDNPLQAALEVNYYPTTILLDRRGKVLFKGVGGTESNRFRLDKAIAAATKGAATARR